MGMPVVATDLAEIRRFNDEHGEIVRIAASAEAFAREITRRARTIATPRRSSGASRWRRRTAGQRGSSGCRR